MKKLKVAVIGLGWVGVNRHIATILKSEKIELFGVADRNRQAVTETANKFQIEHQAVTDNLNDVPWLTDVDFVTIATPPHEHFKLISQALDMGLHVLTEKPFTMSVQEAEQLVSKAEQTQKILGVVHNFQFASSFNKLTRDIEQNKLGPIKSIIARQFSNPRRRLPKWYESLPYGLFYDESPHLLYLLNRLMPHGMKLVNATVIDSTVGHETPALLEAIYVGNQAGKNIPVSLHMAFEASVSEWHVAVIGEEKMGIVDLFRDIYICINNDETHLAKHVIQTSLYASLQHWMQTITQGMRHFKGDLLYGNDVIYDNFTEAVLGNKPLIHANVQEAYSVLKRQHELMQLTASKKTSTAATLLEESTL